MKNWAYSLLSGTDEEKDEIALFMFLRHIENIRDFLLMDVLSFRENQFFTKSVLEQISMLHQALWISKYMVTDMEYKLIIRLINNQCLSLADLSSFLTEHQLSTRLVAGWMHHFIRKLHKEGDTFIETRSHPSGAEYCWKPGKDVWNV